MADIRHGMSRSNHTVIGNVWLVIADALHTGYQGATVS
jgi:hypothetical protein